MAQQRRYPERTALPAPLPGRWVFTGADAVVALDSFLAQPGGMELTLRVFARWPAEPWPRFSFDRHDDPDRDPSDPVRLVVAARVDAGPLVCHLGSGGGGVSDGLGTFVFTLWIPVDTDVATGSLHVEVGWAVAGIRDVAVLDRAAVHRAARAATPDVLARPAGG